MLVKVNYSIFFFALRPATLKFTDQADEKGMIRNSGIKLHLVIDK